MVVDGGLNQSVGHHQDVRETFIGSQRLARVGRSQSETFHKIWWDGRTVPIQDQVNSELAA